MIARLSFAAVLMLFCASTFAAQSLTLSLETPTLGKTGPSKPAASTQTSTTPPPAAKAADTVKIGRVGLVSCPLGVIYKSKSTNSRVYAKVKADTPLAVTNEEDPNWLGVYMVNGATGWIARSSVRLIEYDLVAKKSDVDRATAMSRSATGSRELPESAIIRTAMKYAGVPYVYGGTSPVSGMDCSAFVQAVFREYGVKLPRTARQQAQVGASVPYDQLQPGDRLYFACKNPYPDHCGIYAGNGYFIHCAASRRGIAIDSLASDFYARTLVAVRRS